MYHYGPQQFSLFSIVDPSALSESLGNDCMKANRYGIENLKYITSHLLEWTYDEGETLRNQKNFIGKYSVNTGGILNIFSFIWEVFIWMLRLWVIKKSL